MVDQNPIWRSKSYKPTVEEIKDDRITQLAAEFWAPSTVGYHKPFDPKIVEIIYEQEIMGSNFNIRRIMMLEVSQYLESYLWPNYLADVSSHSHMMSIVIMMNEKFRERVDAWMSIKKAPEHAEPFLTQVFHACLEEDKQLSFLEKTSLIQFLTNTFNSIEVELIREQIKKLLSLSSWSCLHKNRRDQELARAPKWQKYYKKLMKKEDEKGSEADWQRRFLYKLMLSFLDDLEKLPTEGPIESDVIHYCERFLEFMIDLEASLPTRRFFNVLLDDCQLVLRCTVSALTKREEGDLFRRLLDLVKFYARFEINDVTGDPLTDAQMSQMHYDSVHALQKVVFAKHPSLREFSLRNVSSVDTRESILKYFSKLNNDDLREVTAYLNLVPPKCRDSVENWYRTDPEFLLELLAYRHEKHISQLDEINIMPLYPTEDIIWNENIFPSGYYSGEGCLALPKLNLQFLTLHDYLLRNLQLFRLESTYEIRQDIEDAICRLSPWKTDDAEEPVYFGGWARMAQPITSFFVRRVDKAKIGEVAPVQIVAEVTVNLNVQSEVKKEWESLRKHDVCFLISVEPKLTIGTKYNYRHSFIEQSGVKYVRGCEVLGMLDEEGRIIEDVPDVPKPTFKGDSRTFRVLLDPNQYKVDMDKYVEGKSNYVYGNLNVIVRRKPKENNFKAVLHTIRQLMNSDCVLPDWLHDIILGYGDPGAAHYSRMPDEVATLDFNDTFLDIEHLRTSFTSHELKIKVDNPSKAVPPFKLTFEEVQAKAKGEKELNKSIIVEPYSLPAIGPYPVKLRKNQIRFTPTQIEAIKAGMQPGLTMVVGPPGTGKTDVAVQIISNIYHNFPNQRILIVTHSNQALNQLFEKIMMLDVDDRHLLRLGHGEEELETEKDFSRYGRINFILSRRLELLEDVERLQKCLNAPGDMAFSCESARLFYLNYVYASWEKYKASMNKDVPVEMVSLEFPFTDFFRDAPQPLFKGKSFNEDFDIAVKCFKYIERIFTLLDEFRAFELLRGGGDRSKFLMVKEAKIIAMTCTHAALKRSELVEMGFKFDTILMEEAAQILEIETFIPLLVQRVEDGFNRLKRWIMIGDHHQLPPVIKNMSFQKYSNMEQSLFTRLVRLGVPTVDLDAQGRARPSICNLYNWRYKNLGNLGHVERELEYKLANPGFQFEFQFINVDDFNGVGESEPSPYFYQNLAEAEYCVAVYMYMRILGYPADKISILTTYNGQKHLIRDVINARCSTNSMIGKPHKVATVDKYQGQQNDYILLSLVRTKSVGHIRDVRRLIVALSRARLGLYIFGRSSLFFNCFELRMAMAKMQSRPLYLHLYPNERFPTQRNLYSPLPVEPTVMTDMVSMANFVYNLYHSLYYANYGSQASSRKEWYKPGEVVGGVPDYAVPTHPGGESDSDDESSGSEKEGMPEHKTESASREENSTQECSVKNLGVTVNQDSEEGMEVTAAECPPDDE